MALTRFASNKLSGSRPTLTSRANNAKRFTNIRANSLNISNPAIPSAYFIFTTATPALQEGISTTVTVQGYNLAVAAQNGIYYWTIESNAGDFDASSGSFTLTSAGNLYGYSAGSFTLTPTGDDVQEGTETFTIAIRSGSISGPIISTSLPITINDQVPDTYFNYVTLLLSSNGVNNANNSVFVDSSTNNFAITRNGNATQGSFTPPFGDYINSIYVGGGGSSGYLTPSNYGLTINGAFTFEAWVYLTTADRNQIFGEPYGGAYSTQWGIGFIPGGQVYAPGINPGLTFNLGPQSGYGNNYAYGAGLGYPSLHTWTHIAICRDADNNWHFYQNGVKGTTSNINAYAHPYTQFPSNNGPAGSFLLPMYMFNYDGQIGGGNSSYMSAGFNGYLADVRLVNGTALYTGASLTVPTSRLTAIQNTEVLLGKNGFTNTANTALKFTTTSVSGTRLKESRIGPVTSTSSPYSTSVQGGSAYFDGSGDYLNTAAQSSVPAIANAHTFLAGVDFTIEAWVYLTAAVAYQELIGVYSGSSSGRWIIRTSADGQTLGFYHYPSVSDVAMGTQLSLNTWYHIALVRSGTSIKGYINGVGTTVYTGSINLDGGAEALYIGQAYPGRTPWNGYISNLRIVRGTPVYTANFTPPTAPVTAITNTQLLCNFTNAGIIDNSMQVNLETVGDAKISTIQSKYGGSSMSFDGSGDYLFIPTADAKPLSKFLTGNFTVECWAYLTTTGTSQTIICAVNNWAAGANYNIRVVTGNFLSVQIGNSITLINGTVAFPLNQWNHIALVRDSATSTKFYLNGSNVASTATNWTADEDCPVTIGAFNTNGSSIGEYWTGYIDDLRITSNIARYTANFTPPALSFPTQ